MKKLNITVAALLLMGFTGLAYGEMGKCNGMQNPHMKNKSDMMQQGNQGMMHGNKGMMKNATSQDQVNMVKQCVNAATTLQEIENCKVGMMQGNQGMMKMEGGNMENKAGKCKGN